MNYKYLKFTLVRLFFLSTIIFISNMAQAQDQAAGTLKSVLLKQLKSTHSEKDWFVPIKVALKDVTAEQANWKDNSGNHSIGQLTSHLIFWNERVLKQFKNENPGEFSGNNEETFVKFEKDSWENTLKKLEGIMAELEKFVEQADEKKIQELAETIANISTHNAYHTGQIVFVRKLQGSWNEANGVK